MQKLVFVYNSPMHNKIIVPPQLVKDNYFTHSPIIKEWADERRLATSAPKSTITLFTPQFAQANTHPRVTLNNSILPLERTPSILDVTFDPHFKFNAHIKSSVTWALPRINILKALTSTNWGQ